MHFLWSWNIACDLFLIEMKFSPPQAKQNLTALHPLSESCRDSQTSLHVESTDIHPWDELFRKQATVLRTASLFGHIAWGSGGVSTRVTRSSAALGFTSPSRLSVPAASRHAPPAPDCLIRTFQVRGPDKPGQSALRQWYTCSAVAGVAALFFSALPEVLRRSRSKRRHGREKNQWQMTSLVSCGRVRKDLFFLCGHHFDLYSRPSFKRDRGVKKHNKVIVVKVPVQSVLERNLSVRPLIRPRGLNWTGVCCLQQSDSRHRLVFNTLQHKQTINFILSWSCLPNSYRSYSCLILWDITNWYKTDPKGFYWLYNSFMKLKDE